MWRHVDVTSRFCVSRVLNACFSKFDVLRGVIFMG